MAQNEKTDFIPLDFSDDDTTENSHNKSKKTRNRSIETKPSREAPWSGNRIYNQKSFILKVHEELVDFYNYMHASREEHEIRLSVIKKISDIATEIWPESKTLAYGSFTTDLYLPTSDIDIVILNASQNSVEILAHELQERELVSYVEAILSARVPIVKCTDRETGTRIDVCFEVTTGLQTADLVKAYLDRWPAMKPLIFFLKYFLQWRNLNDTYQGGVGSFMLQLMVVSLLQLHPIRQSKNWRGIDKEICLGSWLISFFELYGTQFNYVKVGISVKGNGSYYKKIDRDRFDESRPYLLSIENPLDTSIDVGKNSFAIMRVRKSFEYAFHQLIADDNSNIFPTLLSRLVGIRHDKLRNRYVAPVIMPMMDETSQLNHRSESDSRTKSAENGDLEIVKANDSRSFSSKRSRRGEEVKIIESGGQKFEIITNKKPSKPKERVRNRIGSGYRLVNIKETRKYMD